MIQSPEETEIKGGVFMAPKDFVALFKSSDPKKRLSLSMVKEMLNPNSKKTRMKFDSRDVKRMSRNLVFIWVTKPGASGISCPRVVPR